VLLVFRVFKDLKVYKDLKDKRVQLGYKVFKVSEEKEDTRVFRVLEELLA
jgi:hypothetical protein